MLVARATDDRGAALLRPQGSSRPPAGPRVSTVFDARAPRPPWPCAAQSARAEASWLSRPPGGPPSAQPDHGAWPCGWIASCAAAAAATPFGGPVAAPFPGEALTPWLRQRRTDCPGGIEGLSDSRERGLPYRQQRGRRREISAYEFMTSESHSASIGQASRHGIAPKTRVSPELSCAAASRDVWAVPNPSQRERH